MKSSQSLSSKKLIVIGIIGLISGHGIRLFAYEIIGAALELLGALVLIFGIIAFFRERKRGKLKEKS